MSTVSVYAIGSTYVYEAAETIRRLSWNVAAWLANQPGPAPADLSPVHQADTISDEELRRWPIVVPLVTPGHRRAVELELAARGVESFAILIDPTSPVASSAELHDGVYVNAAAVVAARTALGRLVSINRSASVGHHSILEDYSTVGPGALLCGGCTLDRGAFVGAGAVITPDRRIGANAVVGAGAVVTRDVPANTFVFGNPATVVREVVGHNGLSV
jgi:sugar O-acyltransferase (sialic acid O-acetyltransferase NeuD family)